MERTPFIAPKVSDAAMPAMRAISRFDSAELTHDCGNRSAFLCGAGDDHYFTTSGWFVTSENCCPGGHDFRVGSEKVNATAGVWPAIHGSVTRKASLERAEDLAACTANASFKMSVCNNAVASIKAPGSDKGQMLPADCAAICESDKFKSTAGSCLGWSIVPSTVRRAHPQHP